jgi:hypothetical protein
MDMFIYSTFLILIGFALPVIIILYKRVSFLRRQLGQREILFNKCLELITKHERINVDVYLERAYADAFEGGN